ncbi:hypothetical protein HDU96_006970 [Phlyctochytrium bullatum]|nr:hypothetical protein HDU96_006970 [Phlyctochytrium bullatum]
MKFSAEVTRDIVRTAKVIDFLIDKLPGIKHTPEQQMEMIHELEKINNQEGEVMLRAIEEAESLLPDIRAAKKFILDDQFESMRRGEY